MKKSIKIDNLNDIKQVKLLSSTLLGLPEVENLEADLDDKIVTLELNENISDSILKYYISLSNLNVLEIKEI